MMTSQLYPLRGSELSHARETPTRSVGQAGRRPQLDKKHPLKGLSVTQHTAPHEATPSRKHKLPSIIHVTRSTSLDGCTLIRLFPPTVPDVGGLSLLDAALAYASAGWFVLPVEPGTKNPGSVVGAGWQRQSSRDPEQIRRWWDETPDYGIALHVGRSGGVIFDLDNAALDELPRDIADGLRQGACQLSRRYNPDRGHYLFVNDGGYGNGAGAFRPFGDVRGKNGVIIAAPTPHTKDDGEYRWTRTDVVPALPEALRRCLSQAPEHEAEPLTNIEFTTFVDAPEHNQADRPAALDGVLRQFEQEVRDGGSSHETLVRALPWAFREVRAGCYPAGEAVQRLQEAFHESFAWEGRNADGRKRPTANEFLRVATWAAAQAELADPAETMARLDRGTVTGDLDADVERELAKIRVRDRAKAVYAEEKARDRLLVNADRAMDGLAFLTESADETPLWGADDRVMWAPGEGLMICGPQGVGKSTIVQQLMLARLGLTEPEFCGLPVIVDERPILYLAMDRPPQIRRSINRMVNATDENVAATLKRQLVVWKGPPPVNAAEAPEVFAQWVAMHGRDPGLVIVDSLKDLASGLGEDAVGAGINTAMQTILANGTEFIDLHHQRKATSDNRKPDKLADVFGSTWLTSGMGSVVLVWGDAGSPKVELSHLKQPASPVGPLIVNHAHGQGLSSARDPMEMVLRLATDAGANGITEAATVWGVYEVEPGDDGFDSAKKRIRRRLDKLKNDGLLVHTPGVKGGAGGGGRPATWTVV
ncbi:bifunctional DNA primase/polymerase [Gordonia sp. Z-3]|uniref:bifunctional DNA primase/polymerase n=1 Tax=Gordonia sp. Z-3 TaxID=3115408 RepID=UPI002E2CFBCD|nr:bifunctional DNA primase/polymerase [Gordonia sp. Z-3]MED5802861.1 bifunctional DNA primase/polymerase [Gordonia sp. Z-3]